MALKGSPGGIAVIGLGAFFVALAYTGRIQEVWQAAFGDTSMSSPGGSDGGSGDGGSSRDDPADPTDPTGNGYYLDGDGKGQSCKPRYTKWCWRANGGKGETLAALCQPMNDPAPVSSGDAKWVVCGQPMVGGGEVFGNLTASPLGGYRKSLSPSTKWSPADVI